MFENLHHPVDIYCERLSPDFWAEPVNAASNLAFIIAALMGYLLWRKNPGKTRRQLVLVGLAFCVGVGSFIFHTIATTGAMLFDVIPIAVFISYAFFLILTDMFQRPKWLAFLGVILFLAGNFLTVKLFGRALFNGSIQYVPTFLLLLAVAAFCFARRKPAAQDYLLAAVVFLISLAFRSVDASLCGKFPLGTHFLWHILNSVTIYYTLRGLLKPAKA